MQVGYELGAQCYLNSQALRFAMLVARDLVISMRELFSLDKLILFNRKLVLNSAHFRFRLPAEKQAEHGTEFKMAGNRNSEHGNGNSAHPCYGAPLPEHAESSQWDRFQRGKDRGSNYTSALFRDISQILGLEHIFTTAYHHQTNGQLCVFVIDTSRNETTKESPFFLMHGRDPQLMSMLF
ncbi:unnamed protein product [Heligmosomoides polygyrus]|uniref:Peptidase_M3 domain-containing protein n=1 Tax=Heligmosomoides polygyrus TaxID=6339 RepID=A0A183FWZ1_HELPZ|nr:unnamed protein product [Heligmosomoides polygyrus]